MRIENLDDVAEFARTVIRNGVNLHPDDDFRNYVNLETGQQTYTEEEASAHNRDMVNAFSICEKCGVDIYGFMQKIMLVETGLDRLIPMPE
ncbi:MAG: hypothetical protein HGB23_09470 [Chlorobiaceae bacterium]|nr:hypothetical protein [Chlorobiaceae bacterium]